MEFRRFSDRDELLRALTSVLKETLSIAGRGSAPSILVLAGGRTPYPAYAAVGEHPPPVGPQLFLSMSDERHVPRDDDQNNHHNAAPFFRALGMPPERLLPVPTEAATARESAETWSRTWRNLLDQGAEIPLILLGMGSDGHTAGLFTDADLAAADGNIAVAVDRPDNRQGISLTPEVFRKAARVLLLAPGEDKLPRIRDLQKDPASVTAGKALAGCRQVEVWY